MRERKFIKKCPCGCGKDEFDLGVYRGFRLYQKPFFDGSFDGWWIYAEKEEPRDELDVLLIPLRRIHTEYFSAEVTREDQSLEEAEKSVIGEINNFWARKEALINKAKEGVFKVEPQEENDKGR